MTVRRRPAPQLNDATLRLSDEDIEAAVASEVASKVLVHNMQEQIRDLKERADESNHLGEKIDDRFDTMEQKLEEHVRVVEKIADAVADHQRLVDSSGVATLSEVERNAFPKVLRSVMSFEKFTHGLRGFIVLGSGAAIAIAAAIQIIEAIQKVAGH